MSTAGELIRQRKYQEVWQKYCSFIDLSVDEFSEIQRHMLLEQLRLLQDCELGHKLLWGAKPSSVEEFRQKVPFTKYKDYIPYLLDKREDVLPEKPISWQRTSGRSGEYPCKWIPLTERLSKEVAGYAIAWGIFASSGKRGTCMVRDHDKMLYGMAPPPFATGVLARCLEDELSGVIDMLPPWDKAEELEFQDRIKEAFSLALSEGMDFAFAVSSIMVAIGERFSQGANNVNLSTILSRPRAIPRLAKGLVKSKLARRPMLPRDLWQLKGLMSAGMDTAVLREKIKYYWGQYPLEAYGSAEMLATAFQTWDHKDMVFVPSIAFYEFITEEERLTSARDKSYRPRTLLLDELQVGQRYEIVFTSLLGGPFVRYRIGDMLEVTALRNEELNINLPQVAFYGRCDDIIDIGMFFRFTEKTLWQAIENTGIGYNLWTGRKEVHGNDPPILHLYIELKRQDKTAEEVKLAVHQSLKELNREWFEHWTDVEETLSWELIRVTLLPEGAFTRYLAEQQAAGAELAHLKPPQINAKDEVIYRLLKPVSNNK